MNIKFNWRTSWLLVFFAAAFALIGIKLAYWQFLQLETISLLAGKRPSYSIGIEEVPRGQILDRNRVSLTDAGFFPALLVFPPLMENPDLVLEILEELWPQEYVSYEKTFSLASFSVQSPFVLKRGLNEDETKRVSILNEPGLIVADIYTRYGSDSLASHLIGHLGSLTKEQWEALSPQDQSFYQQTMAVGVKGLEALYDRELQALEPKGWWIAQVDGRGKMISGLGLEYRDNPHQEDRTNLVLTLDWEIQNYVERLMDEKIPKGVAIVIDIATGDVVAMASRPTFRQGEVQNYLFDNTEGYFLNRALIPYYPGSVFKILVTAAALEEKVVTPEEFFHCNGAISFETGQIISCWQLEGHGSLTFKEAFSHSCNPVFIEVAHRLGREKLLAYVERFGLNSQELIGYPMPVYQGVKIPFNNPVSIANAALGQEGVLISPLQGTELVMTIAKDGIKRPVRIVAMLESDSGRVRQEFNSSPGQRVISLETARLLQEMLGEVTSSGTGRNAYVPGYGSAGKTGSAQTGSISKDGLPIVNGWFVGYVPLDEPRYAIGILVEGGKQGNQSAAPIFKRIAEYLLTNH